MQSDQVDAACLNVQAKAYVNYYTSFNPKVKIRETQEKDNNMTANYYNTEAAVQRGVLKNYISEDAYSKKGKARKTFGLVEDDCPRNFLELKERIEKGLYVVDEKKIEDAPYTLNVFYGVKWRDPSVKEDKESYRAFKEAVEQKVDDLYLKIDILDPKDGLALVEEFKNWTPDAKTTKQ